MVTDHSERNNIVIAVRVEDVTAPIHVHYFPFLMIRLQQQDKGVGKGTLHLQDLLTSQLVEGKGCGRHCLQHEINIQINYREQFKGLLYLIEKTVKHDHSSCPRRQRQS